MENELQKKFPNGVLSFYIKIYCKKKGQSVKKRTAVQQAMKSWTTLSKSEKQFFMTKYNEYKSNFRKSIALHLKNAEPYLQSKETLHSSNSVQNASTNNQDTEMFQTKLMSSKIEDDVDQIAGTQNNDCTMFDEHDFNNDIFNNSSSIIKTTQDEDLIIPEPIAPKIRTSKELFYIIKERENNGLVWENLKPPQKRRYNEAVVAIKKNYLEQYRKYLENLSSEKLFIHYRNNVNSP